MSDLTLITSGMYMYRVSNVGYFCGLSRSDAYHCHRNRPSPNIANYFGELTRNTHVGPDLLLFSMSLFATYEHIFEPPPKCLFRRCTLSCSHVVFVWAVRYPDTVMGLSIL